MFSIDPFVRIVTKSLKVGPHLSGKNCSNMGKDDFDLRFYDLTCSPAQLENVLQPPLLIVSNGVWPAYTRENGYLSLM
jgi:hypothetical protein